MAPRSSRRAFQALRALAHEQAGYVTAKQAARLGYDYPHLSYHVSTGSLERAGHGLYRLVDVPLTEHDELVRLAFWSRDRTGAPQAVVSHRTALVVHELTELLPGVIELTVPRRFQKPAPAGCMLHHAELPAEDVEAHEGYSVTKPLRTLLDAATSDVPQEVLKQAIAVALERGSVRRSSLLARARGTSGEARLARALPRTPRSR